MTFHAAGGCQFTTAHRIGSRNERFNGTLRREVLNAEWFTTTRQAQVVINCWLREYNHTRPHQALGMRPPVPETLLGNGP
ncbi:integrase core domain-containing protein [Aliiruegeria lutimaris]|uniref:integrase core domain-containing protein n=1 Tax=Aliiruegeria lutimaris TaxID=571298 RepID=UPI00147D1B7C